MLDGFLNRLIGIWEGPTKTWLQPDGEPDVARTRGEFRPVFGGQFLRHAYTGTVQGRPRSGEETIVFNPARQCFQVAWVDDFHMNYGVMLSEGPRTPAGFSVLGRYDTAPGEPQWGWRTTFALKDDDHLVMLVHNIGPDGSEARAVETEYARVRS